MKHFISYHSTAPVNLAAGTHSTIGPLRIRRRWLRDLSRMLRHYLAAYAATRRQRREVEQFLLRANDHMLKDIGLTRADLLRQALPVPDDHPEGRANAPVQKIRAVDCLEEKAQSTTHRRSA